MEKIVEWTKVYLTGDTEAVVSCMNEQIEEYIDILDLQSNEKSIDI